MNIQSQATRKHLLDSIVIPSDNELLGKFVRNQDEQSLHEVVYRHSPMVMGVCQSLLWHQEDAEDAFQATFLVLANKADRLLKHNSIAGWLHQVAVRNCRNLRRQRNRKREVELNQEPVVNANEPWKSISDLHDRELVQQELSQLPTRYREVLLLCYIEGRSRSEAAEILDCTTASVKASLARGRKLLRQRLIRHGIVASTVLGVLAAATTHAKANVPAELLSSTIQLCQGFTPKTSFGSSPESIQLLAQKELVGMNFIAYSKIALYAAIGLTLVSVPLVLLAQANNDPYPTVFLGSSDPQDGTENLSTPSAPESQISIAAPANSTNPLDAGPNENQPLSNPQEPQSTGDPLLDVSADSAEYWQLILGATEAKRQSLKEELLKIDQGDSALSQFAVRSSILEAEAKIFQINLMLERLREKDTPPAGTGDPNVANTLPGGTTLESASQNSTEYWGLILDATENRMKSLEEEQTRIDEGASDLSRFAVRADRLELEAKRLQIILLLRELEQKKKTQPPANSPSLPNPNSSKSSKFIPPASTATIKPGEVLTIESAAMPEIDRNIIVAADQTIVVPLVGVFSVKDLNQKQLREKLNDAYTEFVKDPLIDVYREIPNRTGQDIPLKSTTPIQAGEVLTVESMNDTTFNRQVIVQEDFSITVPLVGIVQAEGLTPEELSKKLNTAAKQFINRPLIQVYRGNVTRSSSSTPR